MSSAEIAEKIFNSFGDVSFKELPKDMKYQFIELVEKGGDNSELGEKIKKYLAEPIVEAVGFKTVEEPAVIEEKPKKAKTKKIK